MYVLTQIPCHCPHLTAPLPLGTRANRPVMVARRHFVDALDQGISLVPFGKCSVKYRSLDHELINSDSNNNFNDDDDDDGGDDDNDDEDNDDDDDVTMMTMMKVMMMMTMMMMMMMMMTMKVMMMTMMMTMMMRFNWKHLLIVRSFFHLSSFSHSFLV